MIPAAIRERAGFVAGATLVVTADDLGIRIERAASGPRLVRVGRRLVAKPTSTEDAGAPVDVAAIIDEERNRWP